MLPCCETVVYSVWNCAMIHYIAPYWLLLITFSGRKSRHKKLRLCLDVSQFKKLFLPQTVIGMDSLVKALIRSVDFGKHWYCIKRKIKPKWFFIFQLQRCWSGDSNRVYVSTYARLVNFRMQFFDMVNIPWSLHPLLHKCHPRWEKSNRT